MNGSYGGGNLGALAATNPAGRPPARQVPADVCPTCGKNAAHHIPPGPLVEYYSDLASGLIPPENMRIDTLEYRVRISPLGAITFESPYVQLISRYNFAFRRLQAFAMDPAFAGAAPALVGFNIQEQGRNFTVFKNDMSFGSVMATSGAGNPAEWDGTYITVPGTQLAVTWTVDTRWAALVGATKEFGLQLIGDLVACKPG
jgi:hypothetical protein